MGKYDDLLSADESPPKSKYGDVVAQATKEGVWTRPQEGAGPGDVGPPSDGVALSDKSPQHIGAVDAFSSQAAEGIAGVPFAALNAGITGAEDALLGKRADLLAKYQAMREQQKAQAALGRKEHPWLALGGRLATGLGEIAGATAAMPAEVVSAAATLGPGAGALGDTITNVGAATLDNYIRSRNGSSVESAAQQGVKDAAVGGLVGLGASKLGSLAKQGIRGTIGSVLQAPQKAADATSDVLGKTVGGFTSPDVKALKTAQQSYLTEAGKQNAAAQSAFAGTDFPSRLAKASGEGRATFDAATRNYAVNPAEFGDDFAKINVDAMTDAINSHARGLIAPNADMPISTLRQMGSPGIANEVARAESRNRSDLESEALMRAEQVLRQWNAAKSAERLARSRAAAITPELSQAQRAAGRDLLAEGVGKFAGASGGGFLGGAIGALAGSSVGGKKTGNAILGAADKLGNYGSKLAEVASLAEQWATRDDNIGKAARWALSAEGPALAARLATLANSPDAQAELQTP